MTKKEGKMNPLFGCNFFFKISIFRENNNKIKNNIKI